MVYVAVSMLGLAAIAVFASTWTDSPLAAALAALATFVTSQVLDLIDATARHPAVPADALLAVVHRPVPRPDPVARRRPRASPSRRVYIVVFLGAGVGQLLHEGHHELNRAARLVA